MRRLNIRSIREKDVQVLSERSGRDNESKARSSSINNVKSDPSNKENLFISMENEDNSLTKMQRSAIRTYNPAQSSSLNNHADNFDVQWDKKSKNDEKIVNSSTNVHHAASTPGQIDVNNYPFSAAVRDEDEHEMYRELMLRRLKVVGLDELEFENYIRREPQDLFKNVSSEKLQALATVINKQDFIVNFDLTEQQYAQIDASFDISGKKE